MHPNLRLAIFRTVVANGGRAEYEAIKEEYLRTTTVDGKEICLQALGRVPTPDLARDFLDFIFSDKVALQDKHSGAVSLAANPKVRLTLWHYLRDNWTAVQRTLEPNPVVFARFLKMSLTKYASHDVEREIAAFFEGKDNHAYSRMLPIIADTIKGRANYRERDEKTVLEWLTAHGYA